MAEHLEDFSGGLVTNRDPASLSAGELVQADNALYLSDDPAIQKAKLRTKYNAVALGAGGTVKGLRYLEFDSGAKLLAAHEASTVALSSLIAETGTFATLTPLSMGSGTSLDAVQYNDRYTLLNGAGANQVVFSDGSSRAQGLKAVSQLATQPTITSGLWSADLGTGFYFFLYTESFLDSVTGERIESAFSGTPKAVATAIANVNTDAILVTQNPVAANTNATKWNIYMAGPSDFETPVANLNEFRLVASLDIATTTYTVGNLATGAQPRYPGTTAVVGWSGGANIILENNVGATSATNLGTILCTNFGFSGITGTITGFEVFLKLKLTGYTPFKDQPQLRIDLTHNGGTNLFPNTGAQIPLLALPGVADGYVVVRGGSPTDMWGRTGAPPWPLTDVNGNVNFGLRLRYETARVGYPGGLPTIDVDYVKIAVYTTGSSRPVDLEGTPFRVVNISVAGILSTFPADGLPPVASTGDVFEDQMVLNDTTDGSMIRYSLPSKTESFPSVYLVNFETKVQDQVTCIRRLGNKLLVGCARQLYRLNYLPRETDAEYDRGRAYEVIDETQGIVGPQAATLFSPSGGALMLAYISHAGPMVTDGFQANALNRDLDWASLVRLPSAADVTQYLNSAVLVNYAANQQLWFYYTAPGATTNNRAIVFHYSKAHRKEDGTYKASGPITVVGFSAVAARLAGYDMLMTGQSGGFTYVEDRGYSDASGGTPLMVVKSREIYLAGVGKEGTVEKVYTRHRQDAGTTIQLTVSARRKDGAQFSATAKTFTLAQAGASENPIHLGGDSHQLKYEETANSGFGARLTGYKIDTGGEGKTVAR